ncbi:mitochondrial 54S ribosomal protein YmL35, partial [Massospora cicadina]
MIWRLFTRSNLRASRQVLSSYKKYSTEGPRYVAPPRGTNEVYDAALDYLQEYSQIKLKRAEEAKIALASTNVESNKKELENEIFKLLVDSKLYQPATKWQFENKQYDINEPVFLYLKHKKWQEEEMPKAERDATAMFVLPDVLPPGVKLEAKLNVIYGTEEAVVLGTKKDPATTIGEPQVIVDCFHKESRRYALVMVDLDHPAPEIKNYREKFQWA